MFYRPTKAYINLKALRHNLQQVKKLATASKVLAVIKANGYGHGIERVAKQLTSADGFGVASIDDALRLRQKGFLHPILLLEGVFSKEELSLVIQNRLDIVVHSQYQVEWLLNQRFEQSQNIWIKINTGMHRLGFEPDSISSVIAQLQSSENPFNFTLMSHFSSADVATEVGEKTTLKQLSCFEKFKPDQLTASIANSAALVRYPQSQYDWVRPGIMLYGAGLGTQLLNRHNLQPVMRLESTIQALHWVAKGESVGYGQKWTASEDSLIAVVAIGYGDGYPRHAKNGTPVEIHNQKVPLAGTVSMDMITVDVTKIANQVSIHDKVILWGSQQLSVDEVAEYSGTIGYELLCGVTQRVPHIEENA